MGFSRSQRRRYLAMHGYGAAENFPMKSPQPVDGAFVFSSYNNSIVHQP